MNKKSSSIFITTLTNQDEHQKARKYWNKLAERLKKEGSQVVTNCHRLKMIAQFLRIKRLGEIDMMRNGIFL